MSKVAVTIGVVTGFMGALTGYVVLTLNGVDATNFVLFVGGAATMLVPQLMTLNKQGSLQRDMAVVKERTNGPVTAIADNVKANVNSQAEIVDRLERLEQMLIENREEESS